MSALLFIELDRTVLFLSSPLAPHEDVAKVLHVVRLEANKLLVFVDAVVGLELLVTTLADKHMATVLPKGNKLLLSLGQILMQTILAAIFSKQNSGRYFSF